MEGKLRLTYGSHDLCLQAKLVLESTSKVTNTSVSISGHIRDLSNVIEHLTAGEEEDGDQAESRPEVAVLNDGQHVRRESREESNGTHENGNPRDNAHIIDRSNQLRLGAVRQVASDPLVELVGRDWTGFSR